MGKELATAAVGEYKAIVLKALCIEVVISHLLQESFHCFSVFYYSVFKDIIILWVAIS